MRHVRQPEVWHCALCGDKHAAGSYAWETDHAAYGQACTKCLAYLPPWLRGGDGRLTSA